ncbi:MAG: energy transducer TonB [Geothrix sp.]|nr:energy transducer TonB [Geothrix sp.]
MSNFAFRRGRGPAFPDLPPTLQPCAVLAAAPPSDTVRSGLLSALIYLLVLGGALAFASLTPAVAVPPLPPTRPDRVIEFEGPPVQRIVERLVAGVRGGGDAALPGAKAVIADRQDPVEPASGLPTADRSHELQGAGPLVPGPVAAASGPAGTASSPVVHDFSVTGLIPLHRVDPPYPDFARRARVQGAVVLLMTVDERGLPTQVSLVDGHPALREAALQAARQWRFEPARVDGQPVIATFKLTLKFSLR